MNNSINDLHGQPTYDGLIQEAMINPTESITYPNKIAMRFINTPHLTIFDDDALGCEYFEFKCYVSSYITDSGSKSITTSCTSNSNRCRTIWYMYICATDESIHDYIDEREASLVSNDEIQGQRNANIHF